MSDVKTPPCEQPALEDFDWPDMTAMDGRDQNLDRVVRDPEPVHDPVPLWPTPTVAAGVVLRQLVPDL